MSGIINTTTVESTNLQVSNIKDSTGTNTAMTIASNGVLTQSAPVISIMYNSTIKSIPDNSTTVVPFQTSSVDTHNLYDATNDRLLITSAFNGNYFMINWRVSITGGVSGDNMNGSLRKNGTIIQQDHLFLVGDEGEQITFQGTWIGAVATNDYFDCTLFSDQSSGSRNSLTGSGNTSLTAIKIF